MKRFLASVEHREVDAVIIAKRGRLTRSVKDLDNRLELSEPRGVHLFSVAKSPDTRIAAGLLVMNIMAPLAQWEREIIGERTKEALRHKKARMEFAGNTRFG